MATGTCTLYKIPPVACLSKCTGGRSSVCGQPGANEKFPGERRTVWMEHGSYRRATFRFVPLYSINMHALAAVGRVASLEKDAHPRVQNHCVMERRLIRWVDKHLHIRPDLAMLRETQPVKGFEDILMWLAEIGRARKRERGR